jgi:hypothetical protein
VMPREADDDNRVISQPKCEIDKALSRGEEGECRNPGEVRYRGALLCEAHATLLALQDRAEAVLDSVFRMDEWMDENGRDPNGSMFACQQCSFRSRTGVLMSRCSSGMLSSARASCHTTPG